MLNVKRANREIRSFVLYIPHLFDFKKIHIFVKNYLCQDVA
jgi:hypothetical protein